MTPQGQAAPPSQPSWFGRNWKWLVAVGVAVPMLCCGGSLALAMLVGEDVVQAIDEQPVGSVRTEVRPIDKKPDDSAGEREVVSADDQATDSVRVDCGTPGPGGVDCTLTRTAGSMNVESCWDLEITCANQAVMSGHACAKLAGAAQTGTANMGVGDFSNQGACDAPKAGKVVNLVVTVE